MPPRRWQPSLRLAIALPMALLFACTVGLMAVSQHQQVQALIDQESVRLLSAITSTANSRLSSYLDAPFQAQRTMADAIAREDLYRPGDMRHIAGYLLDAVSRRYEEYAQIGLMGFGSRDGCYVAARRTQGLQLIVQDRSTGGHLNIYRGADTRELSRSIEGFDPTRRPWYVAAAQAGRSVWSPVYTTVSKQGDVILSATTPVVVRGETVGVVGADIRLDALHQFLRDEPLRGNGIIFITEPDGLLVAQSEPEAVMGERTGSSPLAPRARRAAASSANPLIQAAASHLAAATRGDASFSIQQNGAVYFGRVSRFTGAPGLDWRMVVLLPESDLLGDTRTRLRYRTAAAVLGAVLALLAALWAVQRVSRPILQTAEAANRLAQGDWSAVPVERDWLRETATLSQAFNRMASQLQQSFGQLRDQLLTDQLTGLLTRRGLLERADWHGERTVALTLLGLDAFRALNDSVGFSTADRLLKAVADRLRNRLPEPLLIARTAGDEFAVLHLGVEGLSEQAIGKAVLNLFAMPFTAGDDELQISASAGVVAGPLHSGDLSEWLRRASIALGEAKRGGRNQCVVFEAPMMERSLEHSRLLTELRQGLDREQLVVHYQPLIDLPTGRVTGAEALVRWNHPTRGLVPPNLFIPLAEESGLILPLGEWVLRHATRAIADRLGTLPPDFNLHVNVSARQLIQSDFTARLKQVLRSSGLPAGQLTLELTESLRIGDGDVGTRARLAAIRAMGVKIAIDDFGTGYSSLAYLNDLPLDCLKIDQRFVRTLLQSPQDAAIVASVLSLARGLGVPVVAEGVETESQAEFLRGMGCDSAQGYWLGRPVPLDTLNLASRTIGRQPGEDGTGDMHA
ncbi:bifunctional diguanylate cyclase/phosphodiesterase [Paracidovorax wautersii]|uniref:Diguanylate cyclase (GGDEF) domain-containing protein n=1 Tax=Paracidovorax wautersii TaxID=1177982 RepID=A0A1I2BW33_9BURK|nr:EAL domain-containing protein [Paracidovorax wautersii]SFE60148.1 diguanylate cyclase (GGDEF) domain-containing protein [Paracidovorax wautersii]